MIYSTVIIIAIASIYIYHQDVLVKHNCLQNNGELQ
jgi:hypothetical protein